jgi:hypothetical protein
MTLLPVEPDSATNSVLPSAVAASAPLVAAQGLVSSTAPVVASRSVGVLSVSMTAR